MTVFNEKTYAKLFAKNLKEILMDYSDPVEDKKLGLRYDLSWVQQNVGIPEKRFKEISSATSLPTMPEFLRIVRFFNDFDGETLPNDFFA